MVVSDKGGVITIETVDEGMRVDITAEDGE